LFRGRTMRKKNFNKRGNNLFSSLLMIIGLILFPTKIYSAGYDYTPTIIQIGQNNQSDSLGFDLVKDLNALFYKKIQEESIYLWDSPAKKIKIGKVALQMIEDQHNVRFAENDELFLYEFWKLYNRDFEFQIVGFSFFRRTEEGRKLSLGYIDAADVKATLNSLVIPTTANGQANLTYWAALMSKTYNFNLVKFGNKDFSANPSASFNLKDQVFGNAKIRTNAYVFEDAKEIEYSIVPSRDNQSGNHKLFLAFENYFHENQHEYFNNTEDPAVSYLDKDAVLKVTRMDIVEMWRKDAKGRISYQPMKIRLYVNNKPMNELSMSDLEAFNILIQFKPLEEFIREKDYRFTIKRVNYETIYGYKSDEVWKAIQSGKWNKITGASAD
jgi:hypothetical protein